MIVSEEEETEVLEEVEAPKSKETKPKKGPKIDISGENKLHLSDEQMAEIMKIIPKMFLELRAGFCKNRTIKKIENGNVDFHYDIRVAQLLNSLPYIFF